MQGDTIGILFKGKRLSLILWGHLNIFTCHINLNSISWLIYTNYAILLVFYVLVCSCYIDQAISNNLEHVLYLLIPFIRMYLDQERCHDYIIFSWAEPSVSYVYWLISTIRLQSTIVFTTHRHKNLPRIYRQAQHIF